MYTNTAQELPVSFSASLWTLEDLTYAVMHFAMYILYLMTYSTSSCLVTKLWIHGMYICMYVCVCMYVCMYVCKGSIRLLQRVVEDTTLCAIFLYWQCNRFLVWKLKFQMMVMGVFIFRVYLTYQLTGCLKKLPVQIVVFLLVTSHILISGDRRFGKISSKWLRHFRREVKGLVCKVP
jgi:hypothetical protein